MAVTARINPTLFDKLVADNDLSGIDEPVERTQEISREAMRLYSIPKLERFNEAALRLTVRRDIAFLLNTTNLGSVLDLDAYPEVQTSVLNYGVPDLAGKEVSHRMVQQRAREIRAAIRIFEARIDQSTLTVEVSDERERENSVTFYIHGDITSSVRAIPIRIRTDIETDTAAVTVRE